MWLNEEDFMRRKNNHKQRNVSLYFKREKELPREFLLVHAKKYRKNETKK